MFSILDKHNADREVGQALIEFALSLPILMLFIAGLIDFGMILFSYSQTANSLRSALRYAEVFGYPNQDTIPYLDCDAMSDTASNNIFSPDPAIDITYIKASNTSTTFKCDTVSNDVLDNGDILQIELVAEVDPFFLPIGNLELNFDGQRSIVKAIPVTVTGDPDDASGGGSTPGAPANFVANENCALDTDNVSFQWDLMDPAPDTIEIRDASTGLAVSTITPANTATCDGCDTISPLDGSRCYYAVAFNENGASNPSNTDCAACTAQPPAPVNFTATEDCDTGVVAFDWDWGSTNPLPNRAIFYDADTGTELAQYGGDPDVTQCDDCLTLTPPRTANIYMVAVNGTPPNEKFSPPSSATTVICPAPEPPGAEPGVASLTVALRETQNSNTQCNLHTNRNLGGNQPVSIAQSGVTIDSGTTGPDGTITFPAVPTNAGGLTFDILVPGSPVSSTDEFQCYQSPIKYDFVLSNGDNRTITFAYH